MSKSQNPAGAKPKARRGPPRPTTARQSPAGLVISVLFHAGLLAATYWTWSRMLDMSLQKFASTDAAAGLVLLKVKLEALGEDFFRSLGLRQTPTLSLLLSSPRPLPRSTDSSLRHSASGDSGARLALP